MKIFNGEKKNVIWLVIIILVVLGIVIFSSKKTTPVDNLVPENNETETHEGPKAANEIVVTEELGQPEAEEIISGQEALESAEVLAQNLSPISEEGVVLASNGLPADNTVLPGSPTAPAQSMPLKNNEIPKGAIKLNVSAEGFVPKEINAKAGEITIISLTSTEDNAHALRFEDKSLQAIRIVVNGNETRAIVFNAPEAGDYVFYCEMPHHRDNGETGIMHVK
jgi:plastocyanin